MKKNGSFVVGRQLFDHELMQEKPFSRAAAWLWLISEAAYKPRVVLVRGRKVTLQRGQVAHSIRFMANAWGWKKRAVERFIDYLLINSMAGTVKGTVEGTVKGTVGRILTLCNYDKFQFSNGQTGTVKGTEKGTSKGDKEEELEKEVGRSPPKFERSRRNGSDRKERWDRALERLRAYGRGEISEEETGMHFGSIASPRMLPQRGSERPGDFSGGNGGDL